MDRAKIEKILPFFLKSLNDDEFYYIYGQVVSLINKKVEKLPTISKDDLIKFIKKYEGLYTPETVTGDGIDMKPVDEYDQYKIPKTEDGISKIY